MKLENNIEKSICRRYIHTLVCPICWFEWSHFHRFEEQNECKCFRGISSWRTLWRNVLVQLDKKKENDTGMFHIIDVVYSSMTGKIDKLVN
jgi:hypothetical protein